VKIFVAFAAAMFCGCGYRADLRGCTIQCSIDTSCPEGLACGAVRASVRSVESSDACVLPSDGTGGAVTHAGGRTIHTFFVSQDHYVGRRWWRWTGSREPRPLAKRRRWRRRQRAQRSREDGTDGGGGGPDPNFFRVVAVAQAS
jgi:hypothetical protein